MIKENYSDARAERSHKMDSLAVTEGEDSSYDSECDADSSHEQVSRTTSDTLGQEFAEYVSQPQIGIKKIDPSPSYTQRVEFALKLGYTEKLVQAALARLGADPSQNELLAELIKLGSQQGNTVCDAHAVSPNGGEQTGNSNSSSTGNSCGASNASKCQNESSDNRHTGLRSIVIDGSNLAYCHGNKEVFSCLGIRLCVDWFKNRGHKDITVFVPKFRKESPRPDNPIKNQEILFELEKERMLVYTPSRFVGGKRTVCYDDRYILKLASENDGIVVSNDNYRDLANESIEFKKVVEERVLMYSFVADRFMPPDDPFGRTGPTLDNFLRMQPKKNDGNSCPYGKKCTYGNKCKFYHPERGMGPHKSVTERLSEHAARHLSARNSCDINGKTACIKSLSVPLASSNTTMDTSDRRKPLARTRSCAHDGCNPSNCIESMQKQQHQRTSNPTKPTYGNMLSPDDHSDIAAAFSESCKLDNLTPDYPMSAQVQQQHHHHQHLQQQQQHHSSIGNTSHHSNFYGVNSSTAMHNISSAPAAQPKNVRPILHLNHGNILTPSSSSSSSISSSSPTTQSPSGSIQTTILEKRNDVNMHQKLQRQLSLNPYDPRMIRMHHTNSLQMKHSMPSDQQQQRISGDLTQVMQQRTGGHRQLAPTLSGGPHSHMTNHWDLHQNLTRIASAPDSTRTWQNSGGSGGGQSVQIPPNDILTSPPWSQTNSMAVPAPNNTQTPTSSTQANRLHIQYHLSSIFPEDQVLTVMQMYPTETNPQNICAAILNMFPKI